MTKASEAIVTALADGCSTARDLSQRLEGITYANIRQTLLRLVKSGVVTKQKRGVYCLDCDTLPRDPIAEEDEHSSSDTAQIAELARGESQTNPIATAMAEVWSDFEAMNDPLDSRAWF